jgi:predicted RNA binding protein YcfA (HicA-like mRNA interferase family)
MTRLPPLSYREVIARLRQAGFEFDRQAKGSHEIWYNPVTHRRTTVPNHPGTISRGTLHAIIREAGLSVDEFLR